MRGNQVGRGEEDYYLVDEMTVKGRRGIGLIFCGEKGFYLLYMETLYMHLRC